MTAFIKGAWKAVLAAVVPLVVAFGGDILGLVEEQMPLVVAAAVSAVAVYYKANN